MRPKLVAGLLAMGIIVLIGGGVFVATRPTWHPAPSGGAKATSRAAAGTGAVAIAPAAHPAVSSASTGAKAAVRRAADTTHARTAPRHRVSSSAPSHAEKAARRSSATPSHAATATRGTRSEPSVTYTVKPGDTLSGIAEWFSLHGYGSLYAANRSVIGSNPNLIFAGERITISHGVMSLHAARPQPASAS
jgi:LysM repeat protein